MAVNFLRRLAILSKSTSFSFCCLNRVADELNIDSGRRSGRVCCGSVRLRFSESAFANGREFACPAQAENQAEDKQCRQHPPDSARAHTACLHEITTEQQEHQCIGGQPDEDSRWLEVGKSLDFGFWNF